jgi:tetratricopeptide (TPR) repeat protein
MADRYTYVPLIGIFIMLSWGAADMSRLLGIPRRIVGGACGVLLIGLAAVTWTQTTYWRDRLALFGHTLEVTQNNYKIRRALAMVHALRGQELLQEKRPAEAVEHFQAANEYQPVDPLILFHLGVALADDGRLLDAAFQPKRVIDIKPDWQEVHLTLGTV